MQETDSRYHAALREYAAAIKSQQRQRSYRAATFFARANFARTKFVDHSIASYMLPISNQVAYSISPRKALDLLQFGTV